MDWYHLSLRYRNFPTDNDGNLYVPVRTLDDLNAIRNHTTGNYALTQHLDFNDDDSYSSTANKVLWTVDDYDDANDLGWSPLASSTNPFNGIFDGNGYTITGLQINTASNRVGLFDAIGADGIVRNLGLIDVHIEGVNNISALAVENGGTITNSYASGVTIIGTKARYGGLVASNNDTGSIIGSYAIGVTIGGDGLTLGGLVAGNEGLIANSYAVGTITGRSAGGLVGNLGNGSVINSYADVEIVSSIGFSGGLLGSVSSACSLSCNISNNFALGSVRSSGNRNGGFIGSF